MLKERLAAANMVAEKLRKVEQAIDNAIMLSGELAANLPKAQAVANLSPIVGDAAFSRLQAAIACLFQCRSETVGLHMELSKVQHRMGLRNFVVGIGDLGKLLPKAGQIVDVDALPVSDEAMRAA